jgi:hypothetical protein
MRYGGLEFAYAAPIADALAQSNAFRSWVLSRSPFLSSASRSRLLKDEMIAKRSPKAENWWRSHYSGRCKCPGCSGQETDLFAVFEDEGGYRFALHFEVKQPRDRFPTTKDQAANYRTRAECWVSSAPQSVLPHAASATCLLYSERQRSAYGRNISEFDFAITFEEIREAFPQIPIPIE